MLGEAPSNSTPAGNPIMDTLFLVCAGLGGTLIVCQFLASLLGLGGEHDVDHGGGDHGDLAHAHDHDHSQHGHGNWLLGMLTFRSVSAAVTFFGLGGLTALYYGANAPSAGGVAMGAGAGALYAVASLMRWLAGLKADGTARIDRAVGRTGSVYLRVPGSKAGAGKVQLNLQNRTVEYLAVTPGPELPTGAAVRVVGVVATDTVEVEAA
jgi:hypothetical protein